jgi:hemoglobin-like flavoprotein
MAPITPTQIALIRTSFAQVAPTAAMTADLFYGRLFETAPRLRVLFPDDLSEQKTKLMAMLGTVVDGLDRLDTLMPAVRALGQRHRGYGITAEDFYPVGSALLWTLEQGLGDAFTAETKDAWVTAYAVLSQAMIDAGSEACRAA